MSHIEIDSTDLNQTEVALRIAAAAFETQDGIIVTDAHKVILRSNRAFSRITGFSAEELIGVSPFLLRSGLHGEDFYQSMWESVARNGYWHGEVWDRRKNGDIFPLYLTLTAVTDMKGEITHFVGSFVDITVQKQAEKVLLEARQRLENQVASTREELENLREETTEINTALKVLLNHRETDKSDAQNALLCEVEETILPFLQKLKGASTGRRQTIRLISILETNLQHLVKSYGNATKLSTAFHKLTPIEIEVASLLKQGLSTKLIAATLNMAPGTVSIHRKHIRKKFGLDAKAINLHSYLKSLSE
ncbi:MAG: PAS domain S-box protein [Methylococcales bacterium]